MYFNMKFKDILNVVIILLIFIAMYAFSAFSVGIKKIKNNWPEYRCNPAIMPFADQFGHDSMTNFVSCISSMQGESMKIFLIPIHALFGLLGDLSKDIVESISYITSFFPQLKTSIFGNFGSIFSVFFNLIVQFQKTIIKLKDMLMKITGVMATLIYTFSSFMKMGDSFMAGPIVSTLDTLCFKHDTKIKVKHSGALCKIHPGVYKKISDIHLGDVLINGSEVIGLLKLKGSDKNPFYRIWSRKLKEYIYVTGSHRILSEKADDKFENYIEVCDFEKADKTTDFDSELYCLITSDHRIPIGEYTFWDWED